MKFSVADYWSRRYSRCGDAAVAYGGRKQNYKPQERNIRRAVAALPLRGAHALDFGAGVGRFLPFLRERYDEVSAVELTPFGRCRISERRFDNVTILASTCDMPDGCVDLIWACLSLMHIVDEEDYQAAVRDLRRVACHAARLVLIETRNVKDVHVISRDPRDQLKDFGCEGGFSSIDVDRPGSHHLITGILR